MRRSATLIVFASVLFWAASASARPIGNNEQLPSLFANDGVPGMAGPVSSTGIATDGKAYILRVRGAYGAYDRRLMLGIGAASIGWRLCGDRVGARGQDAEYIWGLPLLISVFCPALPIAHGNLVIDDGAGFSHHAPATTLPTPAGLSPSNRYEYLVQRTNGDGPVSVGILDSTISDNRRALHPRVRALRVADCVADGWMDFGTTYATEADCLAQVP